jgi:type IV pilus assembly protein PilW
MKPRLNPASRRSIGFSLIELLVSMAIGLVVTLAITSVLVRSEGTKRSTTSVNDLSQTGAYSAYLLDRAIRNAGSGFSQTWSTMYGCLLNASSGGTQVLPASLSASPTFANVTSTTMPTRLSPVIIGKDLADSGTQVRGDVLMVMGGTAGAAEMPLAVTPGSVTSSQLLVSNTLGYQANNIILLADTSVTGGCLLEQVGPTVGGTPQVVPLSGTYYTGSGASVNLTDFGAGTIMAQLGVDVTNPPQLQLFGVGANNALFSYDLLQVGGDEQPIADGVVEMRAVYGLDTTSPPDGVLDSWVDPVSGSGYEASALLDGSLASQAKLRQIVAIRLGFILRTSLPERPQDYQQPAGTTLTLFSDLPTAVQQTRTLSTSDLNYRFRTVEATIPLPNVLEAPQS